MSQKKNPEARTGNANPPREVVPLTATEVVVATAPAAPEHLDDVAARVWADVWSAGLGFYVEATDSHTIERYASLQGRRRLFLDELEADGYTTVGSQGQLVMHPLARVVSEIEGKLVALEDRLGLSPQARLNLGISQVEVKSKLDSYLSTSQ